MSTIVCEFGREALDSLERCSDKTEFIPLLKHMIMCCDSGMIAMGQGKRDREMILSFCFGPIVAYTMSNLDQEFLDEATFYYHDYFDGSLGS